MASDGLDQITKGHLDCDQRWFRSVDEGALPKKRRRSDQKLAYLRLQAFVSSNATLRDPVGYYRRPWKRKACIDITTVAPKAQGLSKGKDRDSCSLTRDKSIRDKLCFQAGFYNFVSTGRVLGCLRAKVL